MGICIGLKCCQSGCFQKHYGCMDPDSMLGDGTVRWKGSSIERELVGQQIVVGRNELALPIETGQVVGFVPLEYTMR